LLSTISTAASSKSSRRSARRIFRNTLSGPGPLRVPEQDVRTPSVDEEARMLEQASPEERAVVESVSKILNM
jgi:hypothetical protein